MNVSRSAVNKTSNLKDYQEFGLHQVAPLLYIPPNSISNFRGQYLKLSLSLV